MTLGEQQRQFAFLVSQLIQHIYSQGYEVSFGDAYRDPRLHGQLGEKRGYGSRNSNHKRRLAVDLNLFKDGHYLSDGEAHRPFAEFWESLHPRCRSGIRFNDANHYEFLTYDWRKSNG